MKHKKHPDKAWQGSTTRKVAITLLTYASASAFLWSIGSADAALNAVVPTGGYVLSTLDLSFCKRLSKNDEPHHAFHKKHRKGRHTKCITHKPIWHWHGVQEKRMHMLPH